MGFKGQSLVLLRSLMALIIGFTVCLSSGAQLVIHSISASSEQGSDILTIELSAPLETGLQAFAIRSPDRLVIDVPGAKPSWGRGIMELGQGVIRSVHVVEGFDRTRLVVNLTQSGPHRIKTSGNSVFLIINPKSEMAIVARHASAFAQRMDEQVSTSLEMRALAKDSSKGSSGKDYSDGKLSLNFQNIEIRSLLRVIADFTDLKVIATDSVTGRVTVKLNDVRWDHALDSVLQTKSLGMRNSGSVLWIATKEELAAKDKQDLESQSTLQYTEPLRTQSFQLNHVKAVDIAALLAPGGPAGTAPGLLSLRGSVLAEPLSNQITITDTAAKLAQIQQMIGKLDIALRQVQIEARILEVPEGFRKSLAVKWGGTHPGGVHGDRGHTALVNPGAVGLGGYNQPSIAISLFAGVVDPFLGLEGSELEAKGKGRIISSARVVTADQTKALIEQGIELPNKVATAGGANSMAFRKANLKLEVTPQITPEGKVILDLDVNMHKMDQANATGFSMNTPLIKTQILVDNGGTVLIEGLSPNLESGLVATAPVLKHQPAQGTPFKSSIGQMSMREVLVFITPKVISGQLVQ